MSSAKHSIVGSVLNAALVESAPSFASGSSYHTASERKGLAYEKAVAKYFTAYTDGRSIHGQWIRYEDSAGKSWCQPDIIVMPKGDEPILVVEVKLTHRSLARRKLLTLYKPVVECVYSKPVITAQVCKQLRKGMQDAVLDDIASLLCDGRGEEYAVLNLRKIPRL